MLDVWLVRLVMQMLPQSKTEPPSLYSCTLWTKRSTHSTLTAPAEILCRPHLTRESGRPAPSLHRRILCQQCQEPPDVSGSFSCQTAGEATKCVSIFRARRGGGKWRGALQQLVKRLDRAGGNPALVQNKKWNDWNGRRHWKACIGFPPGREGAASAEASEKKGWGTYSLFPYLAIKKSSPTVHQLENENVDLKIKVCLLKDVTST